MSRGSPLGGARERALCALRGGSDLILAVALLAIVAFLLAGRLVLAQGTILYGDFVPTLNLSEFLRTVYPLWSNRNEFNLVGAMRLPYVLVFYLPAWALGVSASAFFKFMAVGPLALAATSMYLSARTLLRRHTESRLLLFLSCFFPSVVYGFNPWIVDRVQHYLPFAAYVFLPLVFVLALRLFEGDGPSLKGVLPLVLVATLASTDPHGVVLVGLLVLATWAFLAAVGGAGRGLKTRRLLYFFSFYVLVNSFWVFPLVGYSILAGGLPQPGYVLSQDQVQLFSRFSTLPKVLTLTSYWLPGASNTFGTFPLDAVWALSAAVVSTIGYVSLAFYGRVKGVVLLALLSVPVVALASGTSFPFTQAYEWLVFQSPVASSLGWLFRDPNKWSFFLPLVYAVLLSSFMLGIGKALRRPSSRPAKVRAILVLGLVASSSLVYVTPGMINNFSGPYHPVQVPPEIYKVNGFLQADPAQYNVLWVPPYQEAGATWVYQNYSGAFELDSSAKPTFDSLSPNFNQYYEYLTSVIMQNKTEDVSAYLRPLNVRYIVFHNDSSSLEYSRQMYAGLLRLGDLRIVMKDGIVTLFENVNWNGSTFRSYSNLVGIVGGFDQLFSLTDLNLSGTAALFLTQKYPVGLQGINAYLLQGSLGNDTLSLGLNRTTLLAPFDYTTRDDPTAVWSRSDLPLLVKTGLPQDLEGRVWDYDYGKGVAFTSAKNETLDVPFRSGGGKALLFARILESPDGGELRFALDGAPLATISGFSNSSGFVWRQVGAEDLGLGNHVLSVENVGGFGCVNLVAVVPDENMQEITQWASGLLPHKGILVAFEAEKDMTRVRATVSADSSASNGQVVDLNSSSLLYRDFSTFGGSYDLLVRGSGDVNVTLDGGEYHVGLGVSGWAQVGPFTLAEGSHRMEVREASGGGGAKLDVVWLVSREFWGNVSGGAGNSGSGGPVQVTSASEASPTQYIVQVRSSGQFVLSFSDAYDSGWTASYGGNSTQSIELFGVSNGFVLPGGGVTNLRIVYQPQDYFFLGVLISVATLAALTVLSYAVRRRRK